MSIVNALAFQLSPRQLQEPLTFLSHGVSEPMIGLDCNCTDGKILPFPDFVSMWHLLYLQVVLLNSYNYEIFLFFLFRPNEFFLASGIFLTECFPESTVFFCDSKKILNLTKYETF